MCVDRLVWNWLGYSKDPDTGRRQSRANDPAAIVTTDVPELRIIDDALWESVRARQGRLRHRETRSFDAPDAAFAPFWSKQRSRHLFSGLTRCGACGGGFSMISKSHLGCSTVRTKGETACHNRLAIRRYVLEGTVLNGLRAQLMDPVLYQAFASEFTAEWNRMQAPAPRLHPNLAFVYRQRIAALADAMSGDGAAAARDLLRGLIDEIRSVPNSTTQRVELAAILDLSGVGNTKPPALGAGALCMTEQLLVVAGTGFEPVAFRL